jgi:tyrosyl-tRNA synthetase
VGQENDRSGRPTCHRGDIGGSPGPEADADQFERFVSDGKARPGILQHTDPAARKSGRHIVVVVVIAEDCEDSLRCRKSAQRLCGSAHKPSVAPGHIIAAEHDQIRLGLHQALYRDVHVFSGYPAAPVNVRKEADAQARQGGRKPGDQRVDFGHPQCMTFVEVAVAAAADDGSSARRDERLEQRAAGHDHGVDIVNRIPMANLFEELTWRELVYDATEGLAELVGSQRVTAYAGFDPTADSLHVGHLLPLMGLARLQRFGHTPIAIVGGATGMIGDPSGKSQERNLLSADQIERNVVAIRAQLERLLDFTRPGNAARIVNNAEWLGGIDLLTFLRDAGKHFTVNYMLQKESVNRRLESEEGISFTEFTYLLLQAYDFLQLFDRHGCTVQIGGSDQWGNITAGIDLIRKLRAKKAHGLVMPLVTTASGVKFGKTEKGAIWLDPARTSPFAFYQFWLNTDDRDVLRYLKSFTFLDRERIDELAGQLGNAPEKREAQRVLAREVTALIHGDDQRTRAEHASHLLFGEDITQLSAEDVLAVFADVPATELPAERFQTDGLTMVDLIALVKLAPSRSEARRLVQAGGVYLNNRRIADVQARVSQQSAIGGRVFILRKGSKQNHVVKIVQPG